MGGLVSLVRRDSVELDGAEAVEQSEQRTAPAEPLRDAEGNRYSWLDEPLTCVLGDWLSTPWYTIERAVHEDRHWDITVGLPDGTPCVMAQYSGRLGEGENSADIEGNAWEMQEIASAILTGGEASFKRCEAVTLPSGDVAFSSPRNSWWPVIVPRARAVALAEEIKKKATAL